MKGFCTRFNGNHIQECTRAGFPKPSSRNFSSGQLRCGCEFQIKYIPSLHRTVEVPQNNGNVKRTSRAVWDDNEYVTITLANTIHTGGCTPSAQQHIMQKSRSGRYISDISKHALFILCNAHYDGRTVDTVVSCYNWFDICFWTCYITILKTKTIKNVVGRQLPANKRLTSQDVYNIKMKVEGLIPHMNDCYDYKAFQEVMNKHGSGSNHHHADNQIVSSDVTCQMSTSVWKEIMNNFSQNDSDTLVTFADYMETLKAKDKDFCYQILADSDGEITGCLWMTSTMRNNFELFGSYISVDAMKRDINILLWPYMAVTMLNEMGNVCVGCEGIMLSEREEAYKAN